MCFATQWPTAAFLGVWCNFASARPKMGAHGQFLRGQGGWRLLAARWGAPHPTHLFGRACKTVVRHEIDFEGCTGFSIRCLGLIKLATVEAIY